MTVFNLERAFRLKRETGWPFLYIAVDLHGVIIEGKFNRFNEGANLYPGAAEVLGYWTNRSDVKLILWTSSHADAIADIRNRLVEVNVAFDFVNENPDCANTSLCDFSRKWYADVMLDDKAGFAGETDWALIKAELVRIGEWR